jgi:hypothetical protein
MMSIYEVIGKFWEHSSLFMDIVHTNRRGNELVAEVIGRRLRELTGDRKAVLQN